jgi:uncharacterized pyridoxamine 5'-phosphate oxidase family protein
LQKTILYNLRVPIDRRLFCRKGKIYLPTTNEKYSFKRYPNNAKFAVNTFYVDSFQDYRA